MEGDPNVGKTGHLKKVLTGRTNQRGNGKGAQSDVKRAKHIGGPFVFKKRLRMADWGFFWGGLTLKIGGGLGNEGQTSTRVTRVSRVAGGSGTQGGV